MGDEINFKAVHPVEGVVPEYKSSNETVGTISDAGLFKALADGSTTISIAFPAVVNGVPTKADGEGDEESPANYAAVTLTYTVVVGEEEPGPGPGPQPQPGNIRHTRKANSMYDNLFRMIYCCSYIAFR